MVKNKQFLLALFCLIFILSFFSSTLYSQTVKILAYGDGDGLFNLVDSVVFGFHPDATLGVDSQFNEVPLEDTLTSEYDLRVLQRSEEDWHCLYSSSFSPVYFEESFDSKINLRPTSLENSGYYFEVFGLSNNFIGGYVIDLTDFETNGSLLNSYVGIEYCPLSMCPSPGLSYLNILEDMPTSIYYISLFPSYPATGELNQKLYFYIKPDTLLMGVKGVEGTTIELLNKPNPITDRFSLIDYQPSAAAQITIYNQLGQQVQQSQLTSNEVDASRLHIGVYYYSITESGEPKYTGRFIKQ